MKIVTGYGTSLSSEAAVAEATAGAPRDEDPDLVLAFWPVAHDREALAAALTARFPRSIVTGCTSAGGYVGEGGAVERSAGLVVAALFTPRIRWGIQRIALDGFDGAAARTCVDRLLAAVGIDRASLDPQHDLCITLADGLQHKEEALAATLAEALDGIPSVGGSAGDDLRFRETFVLYNGVIEQGIAVALFAHCEDGFSLLKHQSVRSTGKLLAVTSATGRTVHTFDGESAAQVYAAMLGTNVEALRHIIALPPLLFRCNGRDYIRSVQKLREDGGIDFYCAIEEGVVLALAETYEPVQALSSLMSSAYKGAFFLAFNCAHRAIEATTSGIHKPLTALLSTAGRAVLGFDTYGEQFGGLHINQTLVGVIFYDAETPKATAPPVISDAPQESATRDGSPPSPAAVTVDILKRKMWQVLGGESSAIGRELEAARLREEESRRRRAVAEVRATELERYNQGLEAEVARRIARTRAIVDNVSFGFLIVGSDLIVQGECTKSCERLFGVSRVEGASLPALLRLHGDHEQEFILGASQVFEDILPEEVALAQLRSSFPLDERLIQVDGRVLRGADGAITSILFTISDVTDLERAKRDNARHRTLVTLLRQRDAFLLFLGETRQQLTAARDSTHDVPVRARPEPPEAVRNRREEMQTRARPEPPEAVRNRREEMQMRVRPEPPEAVRDRREEMQVLRRRVVHTIKGNCAAYGIDSVIDVIHEIEDAPTISEEDIDAIETELRHFLDVNHSVLGVEYSQEREELFEVSEERMAQLDALLDDAPTAAAFRHWRARLRQKPAAQLLGPLPAIAERLAQRLGKQIHFRMVGEQTYVDSELKTAFQSVTHLVRNAIDHGIERPDARGAKDPRGRVEVHVEEVAEGLRVVVLDDGSGIDFEELRARCGLRMVDDRELLFVDGLSTLSQATRTSGRGVGMSAVRAALLAVGGTISVESTRGLGTTITLMFPRKLAS